MITLELKSKKREIFGKKLKTLRKLGAIPAVIYGGNEGSVPLILELKEFKKVLKNAGETTLIRLFIEDLEPYRSVLIHDSSRDPVTDEIRHVDFYEVKMDEKIITKVPLVFIGNSFAVTDLGGVLVKAMQEFQIRALPADLLHQIDVDISSLKNFDDNILVQDIKLSKNVEVLENATSSVASVAPPRSDEEIEALSGQIEEKIEDVTVETEEKVAERVKETTEETIK